MLRPATCLTTSLATCLLLACAPSGADSDDILDGKADDLDPDDVPALAASYRLDINSTIARCPGTDGVCDEDPETATIEALARMTLAQDGAEVSGEIELCFAMLTTPGGKRYATDSGAFSEGDPSSKLPLVTFRGRMIGVDGEPTLALDPAALAVAINFEDAVNDAFAASDDDPRIADIDGDGKPGLSIKTPVGRVFFGARATIKTLRARVVGDGVLEGAADISGDFAIYGDSIPLVNAAKKIDAALDESVFPETTHAVTMTAADGDCATL